MFYVGVDLGQKKDHTANKVIRGDCERLMNGQ